MSESDAMKEHDPYRPGDKDIPEAFKEYVYVGGLAICRRCGGGEADLYERCRPKRYANSD